MLGVQTIAHINCKLSRTRLGCWVRRNSSQTGRGGWGGGDGGLDNPKNAYWAYSRALKPWKSWNFMTDGWAGRPPLERGPDVPGVSAKGAKGTSLGELQVRRT